MGERLCDRLGAFSLLTDCSEGSNEGYRQRTLLKYAHLKKVDVLDDAELVVILRQAREVFDHEEYADWIDWGSILMPKMFQRSLDARIAQNRKDLDDWAAEEAKRAHEIGLAAQRAAIKLEEQKREVEAELGQLLDRYAAEAINDAEYALESRLLEEKLRRLDKPDEDVDMGVWGGPEDDGDTSHHSGREGSIASDRPVPIVKTGGSRPRREVPRLFEPSEEGDGEDELEDSREGRPAKRAKGATSFPNFKFRDVSGPVRVPNDE